MSQTIQLNIKQIFDLAFENQKKKNFDVAKKLYEKVIEINPNILNAQFNLGIIYEELNENEKAINCYEKVINLDPLFIHSYNNLGLIFRNLGEINKAKKYFLKITDLNPKYPNAYNNLGFIYADAGDYKKAIDNYITALKYDNSNKIALKNLILSLTYFIPNINHPIIDTSKKLKKLNNNLNINHLLKHNNLKIYFQNVYKIKNKINDNIKFLNFSESQVFRRNSLDLNCERHHKVFNRVNLIPKFCFSCFKIQIEPKNVLELIKLLLIFDNIKLKNNNWRKCMIELRSNIDGIYKGLIFCSSLSEAEKILTDITPLLRGYLNYKVSIKRGCSEFYKPYPNFKITDEKQSDFMKYPNKWKKLELNEDLRENPKHQKLVSSISGLTISDVLIINQWLNYANLINDRSYNDIGLEFTHSEYINKKMLHQTELRRRQFVS